MVRPFHIAGAARIAEYIDKTLAAAPPLTAEQRTRLAELLRPARRAARPEQTGRVA